jgi:SAM-dependent methyltransferase
MRDTKNIRGLEFRLVLTDPYVMQCLKPKTLVEIADLGAGTNDEIVLSVLEHPPRYLARKDVILYLIDKNPSWLSILSKSLPKRTAGVILVQANLEQMTIDAQIIESFLQNFQGEDFPTIRTLTQYSRIPPASMDLVVFNRDMLGWLQFFHANTDQVLQETQKILKRDGVLIITQPGLKYKHSHDLEEFGFRFVKRGVINLETGKHLECQNPTIIFDAPKSKEYIYLIYHNQSPG